MRADRLDEADFPDRDSLIRSLVVDSSWPREKVGEFFGISPRHVRRIAPVETATALASKAPPRLTLREARAMMNDYRQDPYIRPAEVRQAAEWIASVVLAVRKPKAE